MVQNYILRACSDGSASSRNIERTGQGQQAETTVERGSCLDSMHCMKESLQPVTTPIPIAKLELDVNSRYQNWVSDAHYCGLLSTTYSLLAAVP